MTHYRMKRRLLAVVCLLVIVSTSITAQALLTDKKQASTGAFDFGLIFNSSNILLDLESYQAGLGAKIAWGSMALRGNCDLLFNGSTQSFSVNVGTAFEFHPMTAAISPYIGAFAQVGYMSQPEITTAIPFSGGVIAGVEVFLFDFLSIFAEYAFAADLLLTTNLTTETTVFDYIIDTRMGNNSMIGIVLYFSREGSKK